MGYYTKYELDMVCRFREERQAVEAHLRNIETDAHNALDGGEMKWYDHENDMRRISAAFPEVLFTLDGRGESGAIWRKFFKRGKMQNAGPQLVYEAFDESKLM